jgi:hypothetical protein
MQCTNNQKQLGVALHNYHSVHNAVPPIASIAECTSINAACCHGSQAFSVYYRLLPFVEQTAVFNGVEKGTGVKYQWLFISCSRAKNYAGAVVDTAEISAQTVIPAFRCPSDGAPNQFSTLATDTVPSTTGSHWVGIAATGLSTATSNYVFCTGSGLDDNYGIFIETDGTFYWNSATGFERMTDGTTNVIVMSEAIIGDGTPMAENAGPPNPETPWNRCALAPDYAQNYSEPENYTNTKGFGITYDPYSVMGATLDVGNLVNVTIDFIGWRGYCWLSGRAPATLFTTFSTPNPLHPDWGSRPTYGFYAARSFHTGGVNVTIGDGGVRFVSETISRQLWQNYGKVNSGLPKQGL